jgi:choline-sulfatase
MNTISVRPLFHLRSRSLRREPDHFHSLADKTPWATTESGAGLSRCAGLLPLLLVLLIIGPFALSAADKPNILFIFADDQCHETISALGHTDIDTPNLDRLVNSGTVFTHTYNMGAWHGAVCVASRTMLNTGRFVWRARELEPNLAEEVAAGRTWSQLMRSAGYETYFSGKWHVKADTRKMFDHVVRVRPGMPNQTPEGYNRPIEGQLDVWSPFEQSFEGFWKGGKHWSEVLADDAEGYLKNAATSDKPFFMYLAFNAPHDPRQSPKRFVDKYPLARIQVPENYQALYPEKDSIGCGPGLRDEALAPFPRTDYAIKVNRQEYYAIITHMDEQIGRMLEALKATGKADNTYIFFTADHGLAVGHHGLVGKQNMYEHSLRPPMIAVGPGIPKGGKIDARVYLQDIMPTALQLAGVEKPDYVEFKSLLPLIEGETDRSYDAIYGAYEKELQRAIIVDDHKLIHYPKLDRYKLFDLKSDPMEMQNLIGDADQAGRVQSLKDAMKRLQRQMDDPLIKR